MPPKGSRARAITLGVIIGALPTVGLAWAFAVTAAESVMGPHLASATQRVHLMCAWAKVQDANLRAVCEATGAECRTLEAQVLLAGCEEGDE